MKRPRDSQRSKVYKAQWVVFKERETMATTDQCWEYIKKIVNTEWFRKRYPHKYDNMIWVKSGQGSRRARALTSLESRGITMVLPRWARTEWVILHELAHCVTPKTVAAHGREYCRTYLDLVYRFLGPEKGSELSKSFRENRVRYVLRKPKPFNVGVWQNGYAPPLQGD